jgi:hypothetical protein
VISPGFGFPGNFLMADDGRFSALKSRSFFSGPPPARLRVRRNFLTFGLKVSSPFSARLSASVYSPSGDVAEGELAVGVSRSAADDLPPRLFSQLDFHAPHRVPRLLNERRGGLRDGLGAE